MNSESIKITNIPAISAIYYGLLQNGYNYFRLGRDETYSEIIESFANRNADSKFFLDAKQSTCEVYPYWPRAAMMETATFYLESDLSCFSDMEAYRQKIVSAANITEAERDASFWMWVEQFPLELKNVLNSDGFKEYLKWENTWIKEQNLVHGENLLKLKPCIDFCVEHYNSPIKEVKAVLSAVKCAYSSDYHILGDSFIFCSGEFRFDSVIHEFLHHVVHPVVTENKDLILSGKREFVSIDPSYYLGGEDNGVLNAFEEYSVRLLTERLTDGTPPSDLNAFIGIL